MQTWHKLSTLKGKMVKEMSSGIPYLSLMFDTNEFLRGPTQEKKRRGRIKNNSQKSNPNSKHKITLKLTSGLSNTQMLLLKF